MEISVILSFVSGLVISAILGILIKINATTTVLSNKIVNLSDNDKEFQNDIRNVQLQFDSIYRKFDEIHHENSLKFDEIYRYVDSRLDKLENKLTDTIKNGCEPVKSK